MTNTGGYLTTSSLTSLYNQSLTRPTPSITPLVTIFTPPASCLTDLLLTPYDASDTSLNPLFDLAIAPYKSSECYPKQFTPGITFSPGVCPYEYNWGRYVVDSVLSETIATCCPP
jgi:hypothetical protein